MDIINVWWLQWLCNWGKVIDGVVGILTLNLVTPTTNLYISKILARKRYK